MTFLLGEDLALPQHTSILTFMVEFHFYLAKKNGQLGVKLAETAKIGRFWSF